MYSAALMEIYRLLDDRYGPQHWWPGDSPFEIITGAILTQNTNWLNVEKAISNLKDAGLLDPVGLLQVDIDRLAGLIRPAGYFNIKARRLKSFIEWLFANGRRGSIDRVAEMPTDSLRESLLQINGIGPETADSILLYAFDRPVFVVDAYTCRIMGRHRLLEPDADYEQVREFLESGTAADTTLFNEYHALLVRLGKEYCRPKPKCAGCPLESLPHDICEEF
jgi:endonuclease-3 related protein